MKYCKICGHPALYHTNRCARCTKFCEKTTLKSVRRDALIKAWSKEADAFLCYYTGVKLEDYETGSPFYLTFDHLDPEDRTKVVCAARFVNELKDAMTEPEFRINIPLLAKHFRTGEPIDRSLFRVDHYHGKDGKKPAEAFTMEPETVWFSETCVICGHEPLKGMIYCGRCRKIFHNQRDRAAKRKALVKAYNKDVDGFRCQYTGFLLDLGNNLSPWQLNFDHRIPGRQGDYIVSCRLVNDMKSELSEEEFKKVVIELARHFETGEPYDRDIIKFEFWDRLRAVRV
jgi:hypothetical protein